MSKFLVVCDPNPSVDRGRLVMSQNAMRMFAKHASLCGFGMDDFRYIRGCPVIPPEAEATTGKLNKYLDSHRDALVAEINASPEEWVIAMGKNMARMVDGKNVAITKTRGTTREVPDLHQKIVYHTLSVGNVLRVPETEEMFAADFRQLKLLQNPATSIVHRESEKYEWVTDIQHLLDNPPKVIAVDTETDGLDWSQGAKPLLLSMCWEDNSAIAVPVSLDYYPELGERGLEKLLNQIRELLGNPNVKVIGHNLKFDIHCLRNIGVTVANWWADSMQMAFAMDDNMVTKSLSECVKRWVRSMHGYSDDFDKHIDKSKMGEVSRDLMLPYAAGDALATFRLTKYLCSQLILDKKQWKTFMAVQMPALRMFVDVEKVGIRIDRCELEKLGTLLEEQERVMYAEMIKEVPAIIKKNHLDKNFALSFSRDEFVRDILFTEQGFGFTPIVFTESTAMLEDNEKIASTSAKTHLPYFSENPFVEKLIKYQKLQKMRSTYVGKNLALEFEFVPKLRNGKHPKWVADMVANSSRVDGDDTFTLGDPKKITHQNGWEYNASWVGVDGKVYETDEGAWVETETQPTGFWQYLKNGARRIHPSFLLHRTNTGRTACTNPNAQNFPKRGALAKAYRKIFVPTEGYVFVECDLSQAELRIAAWVANDPKMLKVYRDGGDIHASTAAGMCNLSFEQFMELKGSSKTSNARLNLLGMTEGEFFDLKRYQAKAVNFGFIYGMGWRKFKDYARTDYGIRLTDKEAQQMRIAFFNLYPKLQDWHKSQRILVQKQGYVRSLHGALRRLPSIESDDDGLKSSSERQAINAPVQRFASDLGLMGMIQFCNGCPSDLVRPVAFIHDAAVLEVKDDPEIIAEMCAGIKWSMENQPIHQFGITSPIPIVADVSTGLSLASSTPVEIVAKKPSWIE